MNWILAGIVAPILTLAIISACRAGWRWINLTGHEPFVFGKRTRLERLTFRRRDIGR